MASLAICMGKEEACQGVKQVSNAQQATENILSAVPKAKTYGVRAEALDLKGDWCPCGS